MKEHSVYFDSNCADIFIYKSARKNAKCIKMVHISHLISTGDTPYISENSILNYFTSKLYELVYAMKDAHSINFSCYESYGKETRYINTNNELHSRIDMFHISHQRQSYASIEQFINYLYRVFMDIYPYSKLDINTIYNDWSIKHIIDNYYKK